VAESLNNVNRNTKSVEPYHPYGLLQPFGKSQGDMQHTSQIRLDKSKISEETNCSSALRAYQFNPYQIPSSSASAHYEPASHQETTGSSMLYSNNLDAASPVDIEMTTNDIRHSAHPISVNDDPTDTIDWNQLLEVDIA